MSGFHPPCRPLVYCTAYRRPCRAYTPKLASLYTRAKAQHKAFEVVFVSLDGDEDSMHR